MSRASAGLAKGQTVLFPVPPSAGRPNSVADFEISRGNVGAAGFRVVYLGHLRLIYCLIRPLKAD